MTAMPVSDPPIAAERSGNRSPPIATIIGKMGPDAIPAAAKPTIESGNAGTNTAAATRTASAVAHVMVNARWSNLSEMTDEISRPTVMPAQYSDRASVAVVSGAGSRKRTSQLEIPASDATYNAIAAPSKSSGALRTTRAFWADGRGSRPPRSPMATAIGRPVGIGVATYATARRLTATPVTTEIACHCAPAATSVPTINGALRAPNENDAWSR